jgi:hypothetical protein
MSNFTCPRRSEDFMLDGPFVGAGRGQDTFRTDHTCSYCGSLDQNIFMERLERGDVSLTPTNKNYKVYVRNQGGEQFSQTYRDCYKPDICTHWVTREMSETKFYFQHLSEDQRKRFIELVNAGAKLEYPGRFYRLPFFMARV